MRKIEKSEHPDNHIPKPSSCNPFQKDLIDLQSTVDFCPSMLLCPKCKKANMEMDGLMNLVCPNCGYTSGGGST